MPKLIGLLAFLLIVVLAQLVEAVLIGEYRKNNVKLYLQHLQGKTNQQGVLLKEDSYIDRLKFELEQADVPFTVKQYFLYIVVGWIGLALAGYLIFKSWLIAALLSVLGFYYPRYKINQLKSKRQQFINTQLKDALHSIATSLKAGSSLVTAIERVPGELEIILANEDYAPIIDEFNRIAHALQMGHSVEDALVAFRDRAGVEDVNDFVNATLITKKKGGNLAEVMYNISETISEKIEAKEQIKILTAAKRSEAKFMTILPIGVLIVFSFVSPHYMEPLYSTLIGKIVLALVVVLTFSGYYIGKRIVDIDI